MKLKQKFLLPVLTVLLLAACQKSPKIFPLSGASPSNRSSIALIREGSMMLRGLDGKQLSITERPNPLSDYLYAVKPGVHTFWMVNIQRGHPLLLGDLRCYVIKVDLEAGVTYRIDEDVEQIRATISRDGMKDPLAIGKLVDQKGAYGHDCEWKKTISQ